MGLFTTINSYNGKLSIAFISDRAMMPDPEFYTECIRKSYRELENAALQSEVAAKSKSVRKKTVRKKTTGKKTARKKPVGKKTGRRKKAG